MYDEYIIIDIPTDWNNCDIRYYHMVGKNEQILERWATYLGVLPKWFRRTPGGIPYYEMHNFNYLRILKESGVKQVGFLYFAEYLLYHYKTVK